MQSCPPKDAITVPSPQLQHLPPKVDRHETIPAYRVKNGRVAAIAKIHVQNASNWALNVFLVCALHIPVVELTDMTVERQLRCPDKQMMRKRSLLQNPLQTLGSKWSSTDFYCLYNGRRVPTDRVDRNLWHGLSDEVCTYTTMPKSFP